MFPPRWIFPILFLLVGATLSTGQTVINSTFVNQSPAANFMSYNDPNHWSPAEVPNNTANKQFNVKIPADVFFPVTVDVDATISNISFAGQTILGAPVGVSVF